jgi:hypothetical protein
MILHQEYSKSDVARSTGRLRWQLQPTDAFDLAESVRSAMSAQLPTIFQGVLVQNIAFDDEQIIVRRYIWHARCYDGITRLFGYVC